MRRVSERRRIGIASPYCHRRHQRTESRTDYLWWSPLPLGQPNHCYYLVIGIRNVFHAMLFLADLIFSRIRVACKQALTESEGAF
jgi:hypothetical protein